MVTFREVLLELMDLPGATYSCVADRVSGTLLGEVGTSTIAPGVVMEWGGAAAGFLTATAGDALDDLMITSHRSYHLVRPVAADARQWLMIYLCLDRGRSNLAAARRELASPRLHGRLATASVGPPPRAPDGRPGPAVRRAVPAAMPSPPQGPSPAVALVPSSSDGVRGARAAPARADPAPAAGRSGGPRRADRKSAAENGAGDPTAARLASSVVPLPRRSGPSRVPAALPVEPVTINDQVPVQSWATDVGTMRRLLTALRSLG